MKLTNAINLLGTKNIEKDISKKITLANTQDKLTINQKDLKKQIGVASDPIYYANSANISNFTPDIRYQSNFGFSPLNGINYRNNLLIFAENKEIKRACNIIAKEIIVADLKSNKYPVYPVINLTKIPADKQKTAKAIQEYLDTTFYPKLYQMFGFKKSTDLKDFIKSFLITGKEAFEIVYDNVQKPKDIVAIIPIDPCTLQKIKINNLVYYIQKPVEGGKERVLHENQVLLIEFNKYDFGYVSYVDTLRRPFNIMRSMQTSKIMWFAAKSQVRMHIKLAMGDVSRNDAINKLSTAKEKFISEFSFEDSEGLVKFNNMPNNIGYREIFTAETNGSGSPEIEEINTNGPDLTEVDSLQYWEKYFWKETEIPYDRVDPSSQETWGFIDVSNQKKTELNFSKFIEDLREYINEIIKKVLIIQLTLKEVEIGVDLSLLDSIDIEWIAFNQYDKLGELEILNRKVEISSALAQFGEMEDINGRTRKVIPIGWITKNYLDFTPEQISSMEVERMQENIRLGFDANGTPKEEEEDAESTENDDYDDSDPNYGSWDDDDEEEEDISKKDDY